MTDTVIIGGGPAGATAAVYIARSGFSVKLIYKDCGALEKAERVENYYGFTKISGKSLVEKGLRQARIAGAKTIRDEVVGIKQKENILVETASTVYECKTVLLSVGVSRNISLPDLKKYEGQGVSYCAICDGFFFRGKDVAVLGNGAYALHEVNDLFPLVSSVTLLTNGKETEVDFPASVEIRKEKISEIIGNNFLEGAIFETGEKKSFSGLFIAEGTAGAGELARKMGVVLNAENSIQITDEQQTTVKNIWAAGDCTGGIKQISKAVFEGTKAGMDIIKFLRTESD